MRHRSSSVLAVVAALVALATPALGDGYVVIRNAKTTTRSVSKSDVRLLFTGKTRTFDDHPVVVVIRGEDDAPFEEFADRVFGVSAKVLISKIRQEVFKGEMTKPIKADSDDEVVKAVAGGAGNIGVVSKSGAEHLPRSVAVLVIAE